MDRRGASRTRRKKRGKKEEKKSRKGRKAEKEVNRRKKEYGCMRRIRRWREEANEGG
jgi:hypothetical protein